MENIFETKYSNDTLISHYQYAKYFYFKKKKSEKGFRT